MLFFVLFYVLFCLRIYTVHSVSYMAHFTESFGAVVRETFFFFSDWQFVVNSSHNNSCYSLPHFFYKKFECNSFLHIFFLIQCFCTNVITHGKIKKKRKKKNAHSKFNYLRFKMWISFMMYHKEFIFLLQRFHSSQSY